MMCEDIYEMIKTDTEFQRIIKRRQKVSITITSLILAILFILFSAIIYAQSVYSASILHKEVIPFLTQLAVGVVLLSSILASLCMKRSSRKLTLLLNRHTDDD